MTQYTELLDLAAVRIFVRTAEGSGEGSGSGSGSGEGDGKG